MQPVNLEQAVNSPWSSMGASFPKGSGVFNRVVCGFWAHFWLEEEKLLNGTPAWVIANAIYSPQTLSENWFDSASPSLRDFSFGQKWQQGSYGNIRCIGLCVRCLPCLGGSYKTGRRVEDSDVASDWNGPRIPHCAHLPMDEEEYGGSTLKA